MVALGDEGFMNGGGDGSYPYTTSEGIDFAANLKVPVSENNNVDTSYSSANKTPTRTWTLVLSIFTLTPGVSRPIPVEMTGSKTTPPPASLLVNPV